MPELGLPRSDEPFDFRHQAAAYGRWRRDYSPALYDAIEARTGRGAGRLALDVGCGTGFVARSLAARGWRTVGLDFSAPMLAEARRAVGVPTRQGRVGSERGVPLVRARGEALPVRGGSAALVACGTSFHWLQPAPALAAFARALVPGGVAAVFWRYARPDAPSVDAVRAAFERAAGGVLPDVSFALTLDPFRDSAFLADPELVLETTLAFTAEEFHGYVATVEWIRRLAGEHHAAFLDALRDELARRFPDGITEPNREFLYLAETPRSR
jgi:SAM-dependent methyltransferase